MGGLGGWLEDAGDRLKQAVSRGPSVRLVPFGSEFVLGGELRVGLAAWGEPDEHRQAATVTVGYAEGFTVSEGLDFNYHELFRREVPLSDLLGGPPCLLEVRLPRDAPPSAERWATKWWAGASTSGERPGEPSWRPPDEVPLVVRKPPGTPPGWLRQEPIVVEDEGAAPCDLRLVLDERRARPGGTLTGRLEVWSRRDLRAGLAVGAVSARKTEAGFEPPERLRSIHVPKPAVDNETSWVIPLPRFERPFDLAAGERRTLPVEIDIPEDANPSYEGHLRGTRWYACAQLGEHRVIRRQRAKRVFLELDVHNEPVEPAGAGPELAPVVQGWHVDPWGQARLRWWDGRRWTQHVQWDAGSAGRRTSASGSTQTRE